jgi:alpha-L-arabinofuranosidase
VLLGTNMNDVVYRDVQVKNLDTGEVKLLAEKAELSEWDVAVCNSPKQGFKLEVGEVGWTNYTISLKAAKTKGTRGFFVYFGYENEEDYLVWEAGSWSNQDSLLHARSGDGRSCLTQSLLSIELDVEYELELRIEGRSIQAFVDGVLINSTQHLPTIIEPLYCSSSVEQATGDVIVKVVNVQDVAVAAELRLLELEQAIEHIAVYEMSGYGLDATNSFEEPDKVAPSEKTLPVAGNKAQYEFPQHSITIFRCKPAKP